MSLLLLPYSFNTQALSATTANTIRGTAPYLTLDGGVTKATTTDLLNITLSDTTTTPPTNTTYTASNTSTAANPYILPVAGQTFADVGMSVPPAAPGGSVTLNNLINTYNYWGDDDGDGQGAGGIFATGNVSVVITDYYGQAVNRGDSLSICNAPYKVVLTSTEGSLSTQYGAPNSTLLTSANATYYIKPAPVPTVCGAKPNPKNSTYNYAGLPSIWRDSTGFIPQSTSSASYGLNFPTTGANGLYFDLIISDVDATTLTWSSVTHSGITVAVDPTTAITPTTVRYKLTGPASTATQQATSTPTTSVNVPNLPQQFELTGTLGGVTKITYGFELKQWFVHRAYRMDTPDIQKNWCNAIGYKMVKVADLTNASGTAKGGGIIPGATPSSDFNSYRRSINAGLQSEWGDLNDYPDTGFGWGGIWTDDTDGDNRFSVFVTTGSVSGESNLNLSAMAVCVYP